jgi:ketosteroid isomerase-like protein
VNDIEALAAALDHAEAQAMTAGDSARLAEIYDDRLVVTPPGGPPADKATVLRLVSEGMLSYRAVERAVERVAQGDELLVSVGCEHVVTLDGAEADRRYTHVWVRSGERWRLLARHASPA